MIREACRQNRSLRDSGQPAITIAVNVSPYQLLSSNLTAVVAEALEEYGLAPCDLRIEITESGIMVNEDRALATLQQLSQLGIRMSLDDFGTGYSSMAHLREFPVDTVKVDRSFIGDMRVGNDSSEIVKGIISLAHGLGKNVVAEGVETPAQLDFLAGLSCEEFQGFLFSKPVEAHQFAALLTSPMPIEMLAAQS